MEWNDQMIDDALRTSASSLDKKYPANISPSSGIWEAIHTKRKRRKTVRIQKRWAVAATVVLLLTAVPLWFFLKKDHALPVVQEKHVPEQKPTAENEAIEYIRRLCTGNNIACFSPAFKELEAELSSSSAALSAINQQIKLFGNDEQLLRAKTRIENHQAQIVKAMVQIL
jgi:hypothetical protein